MSLVAEQMNDAHSVAGSCRYKSQRREGSRPVIEVSMDQKKKDCYARTLMAACNDLAISLSCSNLGLLPKISGSQKVPTAPFMCAILPCAGAGALTHCEGSRPTPQTMYACVNVFGLLTPGLTVNVDGSGCVIREWREEVRLGMMRLWSVLSLFSLVGGRSPVRGRRLSE